MAFWFQCPICKSKRLATDGIIGRRVRCVDCNNFVEVGVPDASSRVSAEEAARLAEKMLTEESLVHPDDEQGSETDPERLSAAGDESTDDYFSDVESFSLDDDDDAAVAGSEIEDAEFALDAPSEEIEELSKVVPVTPIQGDAIHEPLTARPIPPAAAKPAKSVKSLEWKTSTDDPNDPNFKEPQFAPKREREQTEMDMTPMVDVTFLLLIFFMVTASFTMQKSMNRPTETTEDPSTEVVESDEDNPDLVQVDIDEFNSFFVTLPEQEPQEMPSEQDLRILLRAAKEGGSGGITPTKLLIRAHAESFHERVVTVMDVGTDFDFQLQVQIIEGDL